MRLTALCVHLECQTCADSLSYLLGNKSSIFSLLVMSYLLIPCISLQQFSGSISQTAFHLKMYLFVKTTELISVYELYLQKGCEPLKGND